MAARKENDRGGEATTPGSDWRHVGRVGGVFAAILGTLALGAILEADGDAPLAVVHRSAPPRINAPDVPRGSDRPLAGPAATDAAPRGFTAPEAARETDEPAEAERRPFADEDLAVRAETDLRRIAAAGEPWTLQFLAACDPQNVRPRLAELAGDPDFYLLPLLQGDQACFRLCWGRFSSRIAAERTRRIPAALAALTDRPQPRSIAKILQ